MSPHPYMILYPFWFSFCFSQLSRFQYSLCFTTRPVLVTAMYTYPWQTKEYININIYIYCFFVCLSFSPLFLEFEYEGHSITSYQQKFSQGERHPGVLFKCTSEIHFVILSYIILTHQPRGLTISSSRMTVGMLGMKSFLSTHDLTRSYSKQPIS